MIIEKREESPIDVDMLPDEIKPMAEEMQKFIEMRNIYHSAIKEISTKLEILDDNFQVKNDYNPIHHMICRVKSAKSTLSKVFDKGISPTIEGMKSITDIAGIRVICKYVDDIYSISELLLRQDDIELIKERDYIIEPKESGYRSLHLVVLVPVFLAEGKEKIPVEIQIRTIAMDTWASLEHELKYKNKGELSKEEKEELKDCAEIMIDVDKRMQKIRKRCM